jgi:rSAM/selenodomain-associated transferase 1
MNRIPSRRKGRNRLVVFMRSPRMGSVKRRLAAAIGDSPALAFHRAMAAQTIALCRDPRWRGAVAVTPDSAARGRGSKIFSLGQGRGDLGARMASALMRFRGENAIIVGTDIPGMTRGHIARAFQLLRTADAVFGPAKDGGFWLVGLRRPEWARRVFSKVRWSSPHALSDVRANFPAHARIASVEMLEDVDDEAAYLRWRAAR